MDPRIGQTLDGRYVVRQRIGKGGMGTVYEGEHLGLDRRIAIKFLAHDGLSSIERERFRREARLASRVVHENVSQVYDIGAHEGDDYIVMEYVEGRDLGGVIRDEGPLDVARTIQIARDLLMGLHAVHAEGVVHRDVKPTNVMLTMRGGRECVKIVDFGIARAIDERTLTQTGYVVGTSEFMAPEQFRGTPIDHRADLYAVGITLYAMLTSELPFSGATAAVGAMQVYATPPSLETKRPGLPPMLVAAVERALAKSPGERFDDALQFSVALERSTSSGLSRPPPADITTQSAPTIGARPARLAPGRHGRLPWLIGTAIAIGAVIGLLAWRGAVPRTATVVTAAPRDAAVARVPVPDAQTSVPVPADAVLAETRDAGVIARPPSRQRDPLDQAAPLRLCHCFPADENVGLCPVQKPPRCRCDASPGHSLCSSRPIICPRDVSWHSDIGSGRRLEDVCELPFEHRCPDLTWDQYTKPGNHGDACSGYNLRVPASSGPVTGTLVCDACSNTTTRTYRGVEDGPCRGFWWRTGEPRAGTLQQCED